MITDNYIKMCEQAEEIQKLMPYILTSTHLKGNIFICTDKYSANFFYRMETLIDTGDEVGSSIYGATKNIWLPTQEQLQEMWWDKDSALHPKDMFRRFSLTLDINEDYFYLFLSPNELWLAVVMKEKYHKIWTGEKWVEIGSQP